jgi:hypothetical protein
VIFFNLQKLEEQLARWSTNDSQGHAQNVTSRAVTELPYNTAFV